MDHYLIIDLNIFSLLICAGMYIANIKTGGRSMVQNRLFRLLILSTMAMLALESVTWLIDGQPGASARFLNVFLNTVVFAIIPLPATLWALYAAYQIFHGLRRLKIEIILFAVPFAVNAAFALSNPFTGLMFTVDSANVYHRGPLFLVMAAIALMPLFLTLILYIAMRKKISRKLLLPTLVFAAAPAAAAAAQMLFYGLALIWSSITVSIFIVHISVQSRQFYLDHLTGVFNRCHLDNQLSGRIHAARHGRTFSFIMLDIDNFKSINDTFGHVLGDQALTDAALILKSCVRSGDFLARYAGDEFVIIIDIGEDTVVRQTISRIHEKTSAFNAAGQRPYALAFSVGSKTYRHDLHVTRDEFVTNVDALMYQDKNRKKYSLSSEPL